MLASPPSVDRRFFLNAVNAMKTIGVDVPSLCAQHALANPLDSPGERIPLALVSPVYDLIASASGDAEYVYKVTNQASLEGAGTIFQLVSCCATLFDAVRLVCRFSSIASDVVSYSFSERGRHVDFIVTPNREVYASAHQIEASLFLLTQYQRMTPASRGPLLQEVWFTHAPRFAVARYEAHFGCPVLFNQQRVGARLLRGALDTPLPGADERLEDYYRSVAERYESSVMAGDTLPARVQRLFVQRMAFGEPDREAIARALNTSVRTLQRQLREAGLSYRELIEQARLGAATQELLTSERPVHEVAFLVGYADARAFRRAFLRWTGTAPADFRKQNR